MKGHDQLVLPQPGDQPEEVVVPDLVGQPTPRASSSARSLGLCPAIAAQRTAQTSSHGLVMEQCPAAGERVPSSSTLRILVGVPGSTDSEEFAEEDRESEPSTPADDDRSIDSWVTSASRDASAAPFVVDLRESSEPTLRRPIAVGETESDGPSDQRTRRLPTRRLALTALVVAVATTGLLSASTRHASPEPSSADISASPVRRSLPPALREPRPRRRTHQRRGHVDRHRRRHGQRRMVPLYVVRRAPAPRATPPVSPHRSTPQASPPAFSSEFFG